MYWTDDGGKTWTASQLVGRGAGASISMINAIQGWTATRNWSFRVTTNGGRNWTRIIDDRISKGIYEGVQTLDDNQDGKIDHGWFVGCVGPLDAVENCPSPQTGVVAHTADGGGAWAYQTLPAKTPPLTEILMFDAATGWVAGASGALLYTEDGGNTWQRVAVNLPTGDNTITGLSFADPLHGLASGHSAQVYRFTGPGRSMGSYLQQGAITVDGQPGDWYEGGSLTLDATTANTIIGDPPYPGPTDLSARVFSRWTSDALYLLAEIMDTSVHPGDTLRLALDGLDDNTAGGADDHLLVISANGIVSDTLHPDRTDEFAVGVSTQPGGWLVELGIPAAAVGRTSFAASDGLGFNLALEDDDGTGVQHALILEGRRLDANPATFAAIRLIGDAIAYQNGANGYAGQKTPISIAGSTSAAPPPAGWKPRCTGSTQADRSTMTSSSASSWRTCQQARRHWRRRSISP